MLTLFQRKKAPSSAGAPLAAPAGMPKGLTRPESAASLLATPRRRKLLEHIWQRTSLSRAQFASLYRTPLERYAELVQQFPASESHHHAYPGGMLDHGLEIVAYALKLRQSYLLPVGAPPETQVAQAGAWTAGAAYAALLHDIGKIAVDLDVEYDDGCHWHPWHGPLTRPYRFRYVKDREYRLHSAATALLYSLLLDREILDWLSVFPDLWSSLLYVLAGQYEHAGLLGELVVHADQASVALDLGGDPAKARLAPKHALQRKLLDGLRYLLKEELRLNQREASDGWLTQDALWLVSKTVCDKLRAHLLSQGIEGVPEKNIAVFNVLQDHGIVQATPDGKAIWRATVASDSGWTHTFTFLKVAPALLWETNDRPPPFNGTVRVEDTTAANADETSFIEVAPSSSSDPTSATPSSVAPPVTQTTSGDAVGRALALLDSARHAAPESEKPSPIATLAPFEGHNRAPSAAAGHAANPWSQHDDPPGVQFMTWLRTGIQMRYLVINDAKALVHTVAGTAFLVSPGVFQRYVQERPEIARLARLEKTADWEWVQKDFEKLRLHRKQDNGLNIWTCEVTGPRKSRRLHGYLLIDGGTLFADGAPDNPYLKLRTPRNLPDEAASVTRDSPWSHD
jgi:integrating conjugative element relaxase (TIGR03760 family)